MAFASVLASIMTMSGGRPAGETGCGLAAVVAEAAVRGRNSEVFGFEIFGVMTPRMHGFLNGARHLVCFFRSGLSTRGPRMSACEFCIRMTIILYFLRIEYMNVV